MRLGTMKRYALLIGISVLSACSPAASAREMQPGFFERDDPGAARCYAGPTLVRGGAERIRRDSAWSRTGYMVFDTLQRQDGRRSAWIVGSTQPTDRIGATWAVAGDSIQIEEWGVLPPVDYVVREEGNELVGRAWMKSDATGCADGRCRITVWHWAIVAHRIPCAQVPREQSFP